MNKMQNSSCSSFDYGDCLSLVKYDEEVEREICTFYIKVLTKLHNLHRLNFMDIRRSLANIRSYKNLDLEEHDTVSYDENSDRLAYIFAYSTLHSCVMYDYFFVMLKENLTMLEKIIAMKELRVSLLGGGPAFEAVAICKLLNDVFKNTGGSKREPLQIYFTVIDMYEGWEQDVKLIMTLVQEELCSLQYIKIDFRFIKANLTDSFSDDVRGSLKGSHIVTMFKFLSDVCDYSYKESEVSSLIQKIIESMSFKACLFFLDKSGGGTFEKIDKMINASMETFRIYGPSSHRSHMLNTDTVDYIYTNLRHMFRYLQCTEMIKTSCSAWLKVRANSNLEQLPYILLRIPNDKVFSDSKIEKSKKKIWMRELQQRLEEGQIDNQEGFDYSKLMDSKQWRTKQFFPWGGHFHSLLRGTDEGTPL